MRVIFTILLLLSISCDMFMVEEEDIGPLVTSISEDTLIIRTVIDSLGNDSLCDTVFKTWKGGCSDTLLLYDTLYCNTKWSDFKGKSFVRDEIYNDILNSHVEFTFKEDTLILYTLRYYKETLKIYMEIVQKGVIDFMQYYREDEAGLPDDSYGIMFRWSKCRYWGEHFDKKVGGTCTIEWLMMSHYNDTDDVRVHMQQGVGNYKYWIYWDFYEVDHAEYYNTQEE